MEHGLGHIVMSSYSQPMNLRLQSMSSYSQPMNLRLQSMSSHFPANESQTT